MYQTKDGEEGHSGSLTLGAVSALRDADDRFLERVRALEKKLEYFEGKASAPAIEPDDFLAKILSAVADKIDARLDALRAEMDAQ